MNWYRHLLFELITNLAGKQVKKHIFSFVSQPLSCVYGCRIVEFKENAGYKMFQTELPVCCFVEEG